MMSGLWALQINPTTNGIINKVEFNAEGMVNDIEDYVPTGYDVYYFGGGDDGAMKVSNQNVTVDGVTTQFTFGRSGATYGKGLNGLQNRVFYTYGKRVKADSDYRYQVVEVVKHNNGEYEVVDKPFAATAAASEPDTEWQYPYDGNHYWFLVSTSGGQMQGSKYTDAEGRVYELNKNHEVVKCYWKN